MGARAGYTTASGGQADTDRWARGINWRVSILPYLDQAPLFSKLDFNSASFSGYASQPVSSTNVILIKLSIPVFLCPSSTVDPFINSTSPLYDNVSGLLSPHYVGIAGAVLVTPTAGVAGPCNQGNYGIVCGNGALRPSQLTRFSDLTDGTSNVVMVAEQSGRVGLNAINANYGGGWCGPGQSVPATSSASLGTYFYSGLTSVRFAPNSQTTTSTSSDQPYMTNTILNSQHTGGIHALLADGSVRFISDNVNMPTLLAVCAMNDGTVTGDF